jgi:predicted acyltransferase
MTGFARDLSLDAFRGLTVVLMVIVNVQGSGDDAFALLNHAEWNGLTFADLVFPWFLLIVGLSAPLALERPGFTPQWGIILKRAALLFLIGILLAWLIRPRFEFDDIRIAGVLQRIAIVYLACAAVILWRQGWRTAAWLAIGAIILHTALVLLVPAPGASLPSLAAGEGISGWLDQHFLPGRVYRKTWDPEGILSTLPAIASGLIGVSIMRWVRSQELRDVASKLVPLAVVMTFAGLALSLLIPINKALWTGSFVLVTAGLGLGFWMGLRAFWGSIGSGRFGQWLVLLGQTALTLYILHMLLIAVIVRKLPNGERIWETTYAWLTSTGLALPVASLLYALIAAAIATAPLAALKRRGWLIKV